MQPFEITVTYEPLMNTLTSDLIKIAMNVKVPESILEWTGFLDATKRRLT